MQIESIENIISVEELYGPVELTENPALVSLNRWNVEFIVITM